jgi:hypothetical protein
MTTLRAAAASITAIKSMAEAPLTVKFLQEHYSKSVVT